MMLREKHLQNYGKQERLYRTLVIKGRQEIHMRMSRKSTFTNSDEALTITLLVTMCNSRRRYTTNLIKMSLDNCGSVMINFALSSHMNK